MCDKYRQKPTDRMQHEHDIKPSFLDRIFGLLEGPVATTLVKLLATGIICATTIALAGIMALASFSFAAMLSVVGLGMLTTGIIWIFGGWKRTSRSENLELAALKTKINELEERLQNVEIIERFENRLTGQAPRHQTEIREKEHETAYGTSAMENDR